MLRSLPATLLAAFALGCATSQGTGAAPATPEPPAEDDGRVRGNGYSAEVPAGFAVDRESAAPAILLRRRGDASEELIRLMGPLPSGGMHSERDCYGFATSFAGAGGASVALSNVRLDRVDGTEACRFRADRVDDEVEHGPVHIENTAIFSERGLFVLVGTSGSEDEGITRALDAVVASFRLEDRPRVRGHGFSIPVPRGFAPAPPQMSEGGPGSAAVLAQRPQQVERALLGSVVATPAPLSEVVWDAPEGCQTFADQMVARLGEVELEEASVVEVSAQTTCRVQVGAKDRAERKAVFYPLALPEQLVVITCNYDERDEAAAAGCEEVADGLAAEAP